MLSLWLLLACAPVDAPAPAASEHEASVDAVAPVTPRPQALARSLEERRRLQTAPRTRHRHADGTPIYVNRLATADSTYLAQHAHNPVDWFPWGDEAFALARRLGRPVLLSVGYATCHWCHVMEEESFEDPEIAAYINAHYVPVKVDREERPHVDRTYMAAVHAMGLRGGWPMTVWLTPERTPFYAATYLPPRDGDRGRPRGFLTALRQLVGVWTDEQDQLQRVSADLVARVRSQLAPAPPADPVTPADLDALTANWLRRVDPVNGGLKGAPSFPSDLPIRWLLTTEGPHRAAARAAATTTLRQLADSGLHDLLVGGFHRYSIDETWHVPHFEKTLYDNADLADLYLLAWQRTGDPSFLATARRTLSFLDAHLQSPGGAYASALDADSLDPRTGERLEGRYYTWTRDEIVDVVGPAAPDVLRLTGVAGQGAIDGRHVLRRAVAPDGDLAGVLHDAVAQLTVARRARPAPLKDPKEVVAWNALAIRALARAATVVPAPALLDRAEQLADRLTSTVSYRPSEGYDGLLRHVVTSPGLGELDDHALLAAAFLDVFEASADPRWLQRAQALDRLIEERFAAPGGGWLATAAEADDLLVRAQTRRDGPHPRGPSVHMETLLRLATITGDDRYLARLDRALAAYAEPLGKGRMDHGLIAVQGRRARVAEIIVVTPTSDPSPEAEALRAVVARHAPPHHVRLVVAEGRVPALAEVAPLVAGKRAAEGRATAYVCERGICQAPTSDPEVLRATLTSWAPTGARHGRSPGTAAEAR